MGFVLSRSGPEDRADILALIAEARGDDLGAEERGRRGFVQGRMDADVLARFQAGAGVYIARGGKALAAVAMTSLAGMIADGPPALTLEASIAAHPGVARDRLFLYGPIAVARRYQGRGLMTRLLIRVCGELRGRFDLGAAFVELVNHKSLAIHRHYPMDESARFDFGDRDYAVFTFSPERVLAHYAERRDPNTAS